jgi:radical SAM superfamily enzyme YgiQ (UPF0313 family)
MSTWNIFSRVRQRLAEEKGTLHKQATLRMALCSPSVYSVAMSSLGFQTIYREFHTHPDAVAERAFLPDEPDQYRASRTPVFTYESETPISHFPVVGFSISYELEISGFLEMLDLSGIPLLREERSVRHPLILAGGPLTNSNPLPLAPFADLIILGEGEDLIHTFAEAAMTMKREDLLAEFSRRSGCFVPGRTPKLPPLAQARQERLPARSQILTQNTVLASMFLIEPERGCSRECTYCVMRRTTNGGMRLIEPERVLSLVPEDVRRVGLVGAAVTDHPGIKEIIRKIVGAGREIGISSLRAERLDAELVGLLAQGGYRTLTTASDGASQRLRRLVKRQTAEQHLIHAAELAHAAGMQRLKLYELIGLPGETNDDIEELIRFSLRLAEIIPLSLSVFPFVAKRNTPLDGAAFEPIPSLESKLAKLRSALKSSVEMCPSSARWAWVEYMLAQCGESAGLAALDAWRAGGKFAAWKHAFKSRALTPFPLSEARIAALD